jgi:hypothetical protein
VTKILNAKSVEDMRNRHRDMRNRDLEVTRTLNIRNVEFTICEITTNLQPSDQEVIWTVDLTSSRSFVDQDLEVTRTLNIRNVEFMI